MKGRGVKSSKGKSHASDGAAACTIISRCYLSHAKVLAASYFKHEPNGRFYLLIVDRLPRGEKIDRRIQVVEPEDLGIDYFYELCFKYNVTELCTAVKPSLLRYLLERQRHITATYFDPDILITRPLVELRAALESGHDIVLTPHLLAPIPLDGLKPNEQDILRDGAYNLGFISLRNSKTSRLFLEWWEQRLRDLCRIDPPNGLFTDQKWIDLVPSLFPSTFILRDQTYNVAYWNLHARQLTLRGKTYLVNGRPLAFFHFSGFNPTRTRELSKHQTRTKVREGSALASILDRYARLQRAANYTRSISWDYGYAQFDDGTPLDALTRKLYLALDGRKRRRFQNPFHANGSSTFLGWATRPAGKMGLSPLLEHIYRHRADVMTAFPDVRKRDRGEFITWAKSQGAIELGYDPRLVQPDSNRHRRRRIKSLGKSNVIPRFKSLPYAQLVRRVRAAARAHLPSGSTAAVINKGDVDLLDLGVGYSAWHFPQSHDSKYAGHHPLNSGAATAHLEAQRAKGAQYLIVPQTAFWWLQHYREFADHLVSRYELLVRLPHCLIFSLADRESRRRRKGSAVTSSKSLSTAAKVNLPFGVNVAGYISSEKGMGEGVRSDIRGLKALRIPFVLNNVIDSGSRNVDRAFTRFTSDNPYRFNLIHINADQLPGFVQAKGDDYFRGRYNIGYWAWELSEFPEKWQGHLKYLDEVWVPSTFVLDSVAKVSTIPVVRIPHSIPIPPATRPLSRDHFGIPKDRFAFLFIFDFHSFLERKNPAGVMEAFRRAFTHDDDVTLVVKCSHATPLEIAALHDAAGDLDICVIDEVLDRADLNSLIQLSDCYVSLHRSEGFGLTMAEAMALGKPVIATAYSGNMDFMTPADSLLVGYRMLEIEKDHGPYRKGYIWADPDIDHAAELMRRVYSDRRFANRLGQRAAEHVSNAISPAVVGAAMQDRLEKIDAMIDWGARAEGNRVVVAKTIDAVKSTAKESRELDEYAAMRDRIRAVVRTSVPRDATVCVISKGDEALLNLEGRRAWHFPREADGSYPGYYPADSAAAIDLLKATIREGATHFVIPKNADWWLDHYAEFARHLKSCSEALRIADDCCSIYAIYPKAHQSITDDIQAAAKLTVQTRS